MTPFEAFQIYTSIRLHFNSDSYDCFKYRFKTNATPDGFTRNSNRYHFKRLAGKYPDTEVLKRFVAANMLHTPGIFITKLIQTESDDRFLRHEKVQQSISYYFKKDLEFLFSKQKDPNELLHSTKGGYPPLITYTWGDEITLETFLILANLMNAFPTWDRVIQDDIAWPSLSMGWKKYSRFVVFDKAQMKNIISEMLRGKIS